MRPACPAIAHRATADGRVPRREKGCSADRPPNGGTTNLIMKRHNHLFEPICSFENLHAAAISAMRGKKGKRPAATFFANLEEELIALREELLGGSYQHGGYHYFQIHEPKQRTVAAAPFRDRVVHHAIVRVVEPLFERRFIEDSFACRKGKGTHAAMRRAAQFARKYPYALKCDIRKYFSNIDHDILTRQLERVIADRRLLDLMKGILESHSEGERTVWGDDLFSERRVVGRGLPIGNLTSQFWANVYLNALDHFVKHTLRCKGYVRYMDDFLLFGHHKAELKAQGRVLKRWVCHQLRLEVHPDKYQLLYSSAGVDFCGFVVFADGRVRVRSQTARRFQRRFRHQLRLALQREIGFAKVRASVAAWIGHVKHAQSIGLRRAVLSAASGKTG